MQTGSAPLGLVWSRSAPTYSPSSLGGKTTAVLEIGYFQCDFRTRVFVFTRVQRLNVGVAVGHLFVVVQYGHDDERIAVRDDRHRQNEPEHQHVHVKQTVRQRFGRVVPRTRRLETLQHVIGPAEHRRQRHRQAVHPHEHAHLQQTGRESAAKTAWSERVEFARESTVVWYQKGGWGDGWGRGERDLFAV